jgi:hypothetical protein
MTIKKFSDDTLHQVSPYFCTQYNFKDSINKYYAFSTTEERDYFRFVHYYTFDTTQVLYAQNADYSLMNLASDHVFSGNAEYDEYVELVKKSIKTNKSPDLKKMKILLRNAESSYIKAHSLLSGTKALNPEDELAWKKSLQLIIENMGMIK